MAAEEGYYETWMKFDVEANVGNRRNLKNLFDIKKN